MLSRAQLFTIILKQDTKINDYILHTGDEIYVPVETNVMFYEKEGIDKLAHIYTHRGVKIYDEHTAVESFDKIFFAPKWDDILDMLAKGIDNIIEDRRKKSTLYMINSKSLGISIPLDFRPVKQEQIRYVGTIPIILQNSERIFYSQIDFLDLVESSEYGFIEVQDYEGEDGNSYLHQFECGRYESTFSEIVVD